MAWQSRKTKQDSGGTPRAPQGDSVQLYEQTANGRGDLPAGSIYYAGECPRTGDALAVFAVAGKAEPSPVVLRRVCRYTGAAVGEIEMAPLTVGGIFGHSADLAPGTPEAWTGGAWQFRLTKFGARLSRLPRQSV